MSGLATVVAVPWAVFSTTSLRSGRCKGLISLTFLWLLSLTLLAARTPVFQALGLLNDTVDESVSVEGVTTVASRGKGL
jgi:hypothetical protein